MRDAEWGIPKAIKTDDFKLPSNGFLVNHKCTFGAEVYITSGEPKYSQISVVKNIPKRIYDVTFDLTPPRSEPLESETFTTRFDGEDYTWCVCVYEFATPFYFFSFFLILNFVLIYLRMHALT